MRRPPHFRRQEEPERSTEVRLRAKTPISVEIVTSPAFHEAAVAKRQDYRTNRGARALKHNISWVVQSKGLVGRAVDGIALKVRMR
jgi:phage head maturation protease